MGTPVSAAAAANDGKLNSLVMSGASFFRRLWDFEAEDGDDDEADAAAAADPRRWGGT